MKAEDILKAVFILSNENRPKVSFHVPQTDNYSHVWDIVIHDCNAHTIDTLIKEGYSLSMSEKHKGLIVEKY